MDSLLLAVKNYAVDHWSFLAAAILLGFVLQWLKLNVFPAKRCASSKWRLTLRRLLPILAMVLGGCLGFIKGLPVSMGTTTTAGRVLYFALAGVFASYVFNVLKQVSKNYGVEISTAEDTPVEGTPVASETEPPKDPTP